MIQRFVRDSYNVYEYRSNLLTFYWALVYLKVVLLAESKITGNYCLTLKKSWNTNKHDYK